MDPIKVGSIDRGNRRMLNNDRETKAFSASRIFLSDDKTYTANVHKDTMNGAQVQINDDTPFKYADRRRTLISASRMPRMFL